MEWNSLRTVDEEDQELQEMFGPNGGWVAQLTEKKCGAIIMKDFNCKASEIWSSFDRWEWREHGRTTQLDQTLKPKMKSNQTSTQNQTVAVVGPLSNECHGTRRRRTRPSHSKEDGQGGNHITTKQELPCTGRRSRIQRGIATNTKKITYNAIRQDKKIRGNLCEKKGSRGEGKVPRIGAKKTRAEHAVKCNSTPIQRVSLRHYYTTERHFTERRRITEITVTKYQKHAPK